jgi:hypothetical protein
MIRASIREITGAIAVIALTAIEEDFFRVGDAMSEPHDFSDLDEGYRPTTLWGAIVGWLRGERDRHPD